MGKGSNTTSTSSYSAPDAQAAGVYRGILDRAQNVASTPYQAYTGQLTADTNAQQNLGLGTANAAAGYANPYIAQAAGLAGASVTPVNGTDIMQYYDPYQQKVIQATSDQLMHDFGQQQAQLKGNQIAQGALGGNGTGVAKAILAGQQARTLASTTAGLQSAGYSQALQAAQQDKNRGLQGAGQLAQFGLGGQNAALQAANLQYSLGTQQQATQQAGLDRLYQQYAQAQAFPYQQTQWLAGIGTGVGSNLGGTSTGTTTGPAPNQFAQYAGLGLTAAGLFLNRGGAVKGYAGGGAPSAVPWQGVAGAGWIPQIGIHGGSGAPQAHAPSLPSQQGYDPSKLAQQISGLSQGDWRHDWGGLSNAVMSGNGLSGDSWGGGSFWGGDTYGGDAAHPLPGLSADDDYGFARGGAVDDVDINPDAIDPVGVRYHEPGFKFDPVWDHQNGDPAWDEASAASMPIPRERPAGLGAASFDDRFGAASDGVKPMDFPALSSVNPGDPVRLHGSTFGPGADTPPVQAADDDDEPAVASAPARTGVAGKPPVMAFEDSSHYKSLPDAVPQAQQKRGFGLGWLSPNAKTGLLAAGLGMMASRSPFLGTAVGEGGLAGLGAYSRSEAADREAALEAQKLAREARQQAYTNWSNERKQSETERHNRATEEKVAADRLPPGMMLDAKGQLVNRPGYIKAMEDRTKAKTTGASMDDETAEFLAHRVLAGDTKALVGLGRGAQGAENLAKINGIVARLAKEGAPVNDAARNILENAAQQQGLIAAERTQAQIMSKLSVYGRTAFNATDIAIEASKAVPRTSYMPINKVMNEFKRKTGSPEIMALGQSLQTLSNEYARAIGGGHGTVHMQEQAEKRLNEAQSHEQLVAVVKMMQREILAEERAMPAAREHIRNIYNPRSKGGDHSIAGEHGQKTPPGPVSGASDSKGGGFTPPPGALSQEHNGKIYYYDPVTKKPYPGQ